MVLIYIDRDTLRAWPSQQRIAWHVGCNEKTVKRNLETARNLGLLRIDGVRAEELGQWIGGGKQLRPNERFTL